MTSLKGVSRELLISVLRDILTTELKNDVVEIMAKHEKKERTMVAKRAVVKNTYNKCKKAGGKNKRPPGRPRINPVRAPPKLEGVMDTPINPEHVMEMLYGVPVVFKKIFTLFKTMRVKTIGMEFNKDHVNFVANDHLDKSNIGIHIKCNKITRYYCKEPITIYLSPHNMEKIINTIDNSYALVMFAINVRTSKSKFNIIYTNDVKIDEHREIAMITPVVRPVLAPHDNLNYPIKFSVTGKYFKSLVTSAHLFSDTLVIGKRGNENLRFTHKSRDKSIATTFTVKAPDNIKLVSTVANDDIFSSSIKLDYIKHLSAAMASYSVINISADIFKNMLFSSSIDNGTIEIRVSTKTVNFKKK